MNAEENIFDQEIQAIKREADLKIRSEPLNVQTDNQPVDAIVKLTPYQAVTEFTTQLDKCALLI